MSSSPRDIILRPVVSEKSYGLIDIDTYTFLVPRSATKTDIRHAVEAIWGVKVVAVNTINRKGKTKRTRTVIGTRASSKRAIVKLAAGDKIELFETR
ncbi:MAG TPA: 50S ribosomal protein L23 [Actinomycetota bacterium]|nr:50S ribosomal protein L23 [Actinomycetota bacterium]